jgi:dolichol-phosphate mannosyltransferase
LSDRAGTIRRPLVVLPTYNERDNLVPIVTAILEQLPGTDLWIVDDNSPDGTGQIADDLAAADPRIRVIHRAGKLGLGTAYVEAFRQALHDDYDCIIQMDADFSHDPTYLPTLVDALKEADVAIGSRYVQDGGTQNWSAARQAISRTGNLVAQIGLGVQVHDATGGFRAYRRSTVEGLRFEDLNLRGYGFQIEVVYQLQRQGKRIREVPIIFVERASGQSKMSKAIVLEAIVHIVRRRLRRVLGREPSPFSESRVETNSATPR